MDPNEALRAAREAVDRFLYRHSPEAAEELAERFVALDDWLTSGGFPPTDWQPKPPAAA